eukprot:scaffold13002_cov125-Isochrysis_galbana.AAC.3
MDTRIVLMPAPKRFCGRRLNRTSRACEVHSCRGASDSGVRQRLAELARLVHLDGGVAPAEELPGHIELRDGGPIGELLDAIAHVRVSQHVDALEGHALRAEHLRQGEPRRRAGARCRSRNGSG